MSAAPALQVIQVAGAARGGPGIVGLARVEQRRGGEPNRVRSQSEREGYANRRRDETRRNRPEARKSARPAHTSAIIDRAPARRVAIAMHAFERMGISPS